MHKQAAEKGFSMLRQAQHERKNSNDFKTPSVRPESVEGWTEGLSATC
jgi:hypothetical protein